MQHMKPLLFPISFDPWYGALSAVLLISPTSSYVELDGEDVRVQMGWAFRACFPRAAVASVAKSRDCPLSRGVHGFAGRWLVNGSGTGIVTFDLKPAQRGYVMGFPVRLRQLMVSLAEPAPLLAIFKGAAQPLDDGQGR